MKYDIYFHNDFDGRASSAVMLAFLRSRGDDIENYIPVKYDIIPQWLDENFLGKNKLFRGKHNPAIIVDFPFHPGAAFWFDHHLSPFRKLDWDKKFTPDRQRRFDETYRSACHLVYDSLRENFGWKPPAHLRELVKWLDIIDGARYKFAGQTIELKESAIQVNNFIEDTMEDLSTTRWIIQSLSEESLTQFATEKKVQRVILRIRREMKAALRFYKEKSEMVGDVMVVDLAGSTFHVGDADRFIPYYLYPKLSYAIRFHPFPKRKNLFHVGVGSNPWRLYDKSKDIGGLLKKYGGGGHRGVGGVEIKGKKKAIQIVDEVADFLNEK